MAGCVRKRFSAAREKLVCRATSRNVSSWSKSMGAGYRLAAPKNRRHYTWQRFALHTLSCPVTSEDRTGNQEESEGIPDAHQHKKESQSGCERDEQQKEDWQQDAQDSCKTPSGKKLPGSGIR